MVTGDGTMHSSLVRNNKNDIKKQRLSAFSIRARIKQRNHDNTTRVSILHKEEVGGQGHHV